MAGKSSVLNIKRASLANVNAPGRRSSVMPRQSFEKDKPRSRAGKLDEATEKEDEPDVSKEEKKRVIYDEEIARLKIIESDLPKRPGSARTVNDLSSRQVFVRRDIPSHLRPPKLHNVIVLKQAPANAPVIESHHENNTRCGPEYYQNGDVVAHSLLGHPEEYYKMAVAKSHMTLEDVPPRYRASITGDRSAIYADAVAASPRLEVMSRRRVRTANTARRQAHMSVRSAGATVGDEPSFARNTSAWMRTHYGAGDTRALNNWGEWNKRTAGHQQHLADIVNRPKDELVENQTIYYRTLQENRQVMDRAIAFYDGGKGYRVGSEFWQQATQIGSEDNALHSTLNQTEKGFPPPVERVLHPEISRLEKGMNWEATTTPRYPWKIPYYHSRAQQTEDVRKEITPHHITDTDAAKLQVVGAPVRSAENEMIDTTNRAGDFVHNEDTNASSNEDMERRSDQADVTQHMQDLLHREYMRGPSLRITLLDQCGSTFIGSTAESLSCNHIQGIRVLFRSLARSVSSRRLRLHNDGTTFMKYMWSRIRQPNYFEMKRNDARNFYFDISGGILTPGQEVDLPIVFRSKVAGLFTETWLFSLQPRVPSDFHADPGIIITFRGIADDNDQYQGDRSILNNSLCERAAYKFCRQIIDGLVSGIPYQLQQLSVDEDNSIKDDETRFMEANQGIHLAYDSGTVAKLRELFKSIDKDNKTEWDFSVDTIKKNILLASLPHQRKENLLSKLQVFVDKLESVRLPFQLKALRRKYEITYSLLIETVETMYLNWTTTRKACGLRPIDSNFPECDGKKHHKIATNRTLTFADQSKAQSYKVAEKQKDCYARMYAETYGLLGDFVEKMDDLLGAT